MIDSAVDKQNLRNVIADLPSQFVRALAAVTVRLPAETKNIVFSGVGGSAFPANLFETFLHITKTKFNARLIVNRDYSLPYYVDASWCGFFSSYSGNTEETLSALKEAEKIGLQPLVLFAHDGELKQIATAKQYSYIAIPDTKQSRLSYGYIVGALLKIFQNSGLLVINIDEIKQAVTPCLAEQAAIETQAQKLAAAIQGKVPIIYTTNQWKNVARVWKINFNENSKIPCFWNCFPELNHNEMVGYTNIIGNYQVVILQDPDENERNQKRIRIFQEMFNAKLNTQIIKMPRGSVIYKFLYSLWLGLWTSYYLALLNKIDPATVHLVETFKEKMRQ